MKNVDHSKFAALIAIGLLANMSCTSTSQPSAVTEQKYSAGNFRASTMRDEEIRIVCGKLLRYRNSFRSVQGPKLVDEIALMEATGGYSYQNLLHIARHYGDTIGEDSTFEGCVKFLWLFNDGEYAGAIEKVIPNSKEKYVSRTQTWLLTS